MKDMERQKFESDFKEAFEKAGITPSDNLWTGIELDLEKAESKKMKRTLFVYKLMAAASISFAMFVAGAYYYAGFINSNRDLVVNTPANTKNTELSQSATSAASGKESKALESEVKTSTNNNVNEESINNVAVDEANTRDRKELKNLINEHSSIPSLANNYSNRTKTSADKEDYSSAENGDVEKGNEERAAIPTLAANNSSGVKSGLDKGNYSIADTDNKSIEKENAEQVIMPTLTVNNSEDAKFKSNKENYSTHPSAKLKTNETGIVVVNTIKTNSSDSNNVDPVLNMGNNKNEMLADVSMDKKRLPPIVQLKRIELDLPSAPKPDPFAVMMAKLELREKELMEEGEPARKKKTARSEKLWTSVGFAAGSFNSSSHTTSNGSAVTPAQSLMSNGFNKTTSSRVASNESNASGATYSMGLNLGTKISDRWVMQGGVNYLTQNSSYQTDVVVAPSDLSSFRAASIAEFNTANSGDKSDKVLSTALYNVNNNSQFVSIPVQAGYLAINRKVVFQINAGVSTDLFLKNIKDPQGVSIETTTQGRGSDSPYRPYNFSGLFGTELSYKLGQHYRLAINPGLRYPFNSIYKSGVGVTSNPLTMDIGMRFRYIFR